MRPTTRTYTGPFPTPSADLLRGAIGWRHVKETDPDNPGHWRPVGFMVVFPNHVLQTDMDEIGTVDSVLHAVEGAAMPPR